MKKLQNKKITQLAIEAQNIIATLDDAKRLYQRLDEIAVELQGQDLKAFGLIAVDNFADKNVCFRAHAVRRYEIKKAA
jgi:hypothetical protein